MLLLAVIGLAVTQTMTAPETKTDLPLEILELISGHSEQVRHGAEIYDLVCSNCHGNTGLGIEEGRAEFLPEHQRCEKCHRPNNAARIVDVEVSDRNSFNIGAPPALHTLAKFGSAAGLNAYLQAAMPRYEPGRLTDEEYLDITAFLLALNQELPEQATLTAENMTTILLTE
jgi:mono/diheme cytochrome c family protein